MKNEQTKHKDINLAPDRCSNRPQEGGPLCENDDDDVDDDDDGDPDYD